MTQMLQHTPCFARPQIHTRQVVLRATKTPSKGFGSTSGNSSTNVPGTDRAAGEKRVVKDAASAASQRARPVRPEEAARGKLDYVQVADWGDGDRSKLGELKLVQHVEQYRGSDSDKQNGGPMSPVEGGVVPEGAAAATHSGGAGRTAGDASAPTSAQQEDRPFHQQLAHQLKMAQARGALAVAGPAPPPLEEWSFKERRYVSYLADLLAVHTAMETALATAAAGVPAGLTANGSPSHGLSEQQQPTQCARRALSHLAPGRLGLERSAALRSDLEALRRTDLAAVRAAEAAAEAGAPRVVGMAPAASPDGQSVAGESSKGMGPGSEAVASGVASGVGSAVGGGEGKGKRRKAAAGGGEGEAPEAGAMARSYAQQLARLGREAAEGETQQERHAAALRLLAHAAVLHMVQQAAGVPVGAKAVDKLALLQRRAAATYHAYPDEVTDPRVTLSRALDAAGAHVSAPAARQAVYDEMASAMQKVGLLMTALAHKN